MERKQTMIKGKYSFNSIELSNHLYISHNAYYSVGTIDRDISIKFRVYACLRILVGLFLFFPGVDCFSCFCFFACRRNIIGCNDHCILIRQIDLGPPAPGFRHFRTADIIT